MQERIGQSKPEKCYHGYMLIDAEFECAYCGETNATTVDVSAGAHQEYVEDCQVCCRPNVLRVEIDAEGEEVKIEAQEES